MMRNFFVLGITIVFVILLMLDGVDTKITNQLCYLQLKSNRTDEEERRLKKLHWQSRICTIVQHVGLALVLIAFVAALLLRGK